MNELILLRIEDLVREFAYLATGEVLKLLQKEGYDHLSEATDVRLALRKLARKGSVIEVKTPNPGNYGGHIWVAVRTNPVIDLIEFAKEMFADPMPDYGEI